MGLRQWPSLNVSWLARSPTPSIRTAGSRTGKEDRIPRTEFHCPRVIGARRLFFSAHTWSAVRTEERKTLLEVDFKPKGVDSGVLGMPCVSQSEGVPCLSLPVVPLSEEVCVGQVPSLWEPCLHSLDCGWLVWPLVPSRSLALRSRFTR